MKKKLTLTLNKEILENLSKSAMRQVVGGQTENCTIEPCETEGCEPAQTEVVEQCQNLTITCPTQCDTCNPTLLCPTMQTCTQ